MYKDCTSVEYESKSLSQGMPKPFFRKVHTSVDSKEFYSNGEFGPELRVNEAIKLNTRRLMGLSEKKKHYPPNFFTKPQTKDRSATIYRISYGEDTIPKASESDFKSSVIQLRPFIPPEYRDYQDRPEQLPTFLRQKLYESVKLKPVSRFTPAEEDYFENDGDLGSRMKTETLPLISPSTRSRSHIGRLGFGVTDTFRKNEAVDFPYLSPKARQQMKSESVPVLMSNVFLTGSINPEGFVSQDEAAIEYIITEHHAKSRRMDNVLKQKDLQLSEHKEIKKKLDKVAVTMTLSHLNRKKKESEEILQAKSPKANMDKVGTKLKATVGHLRMERELKRKKSIKSLKNKEFQFI